MGDGGVEGGIVYKWNLVTYKFAMQILRDPASLVACRRATWRLRSGFQVLSPARKNGLWPSLTGAGERT